MSLKFNNIYNKNVPIIDYVYYFVKIVYKYININIIFFSLFYYNSIYKLILLNIELIFIY